MLSKNNYCRSYWSFNFLSSLSFFFGYNNRYQRSLVVALIAYHIIFSSLQNRSCDFILNSHLFMYIISFSQSCQRCCAKGMASQQVPVIVCASSSKSELFFSDLSMMLFFIIVLTYNTMRHCLENPLS